MTDSTAAAARQPRLAPARLARATPVTVWLLVVLQGLVAALYVVAVPLLHAPDEHAHVDRVLTGPVAALDADSELSAGIVAALPLVGLTPIDWRVAPSPEPLAAEAAPARGERPTYDDLGGVTDTGIDNNADPHPPLYYLALTAGDATVQALDPGTMAWDARTGWLRLMNVLLVAPLPWFVFWIGLRITRRRRVAVTAAVVPVAIPQLTHIGGAVNNDNLLTLASTATLLAAVWIATGDDSRRTAVLAGLAAGAGMLTKVFAAAAPVWIAGAYAIRWWRTRATADTAARVAIAAVATVAAGAWWQLRLLVTEGTIAPRGFGYPTPDDTAGAVLPWLGEVATRLPRTFWGFFGTEQYALGDAVVVVATVILGALVLVGLLRPPAQRRRAQAGLLVLPFATTLVIVLYAAFQGYTRSGLAVGLHGRYLFLGVAGLAVLAAGGASHLAPERLLPPVALAAAIVLQTVGLWTVLTGYWAGTGSLDRLGSLAAWAPWPRPWLAAGGVVLVATLATTAVRIGAITRDHWATGSHDR